MKRREFLTTSAAAAASLALLSHQKLFAQSSSANASGTAGGAPASGGAADSFAPLRRGVGIFNGRGGTIGWLASSDAVVVVDTQFPDTAQKCLSGLLARLTAMDASVGARKIDVVVNTHHHGDHTSGNPVFRPAARMLVAHANVPALQRAAAQRSGAEALAKQVYADMTFADSWRYELGSQTAKQGESAGEVLHARHFGPAHTGGDIAVLFEKANIVHMGDLVFNRIYPVIDRVGGASISNWIKVLEAAAKAYPSDAQFIFGHGNPKFGVTGTRDNLFVMRDYLCGLLEHTSRQIVAGKSRAEMVALENLPGFADYHQPLPNRLAANLGVAYDELTNAPI